MRPVTPAATAPAEVVKIGGVMPFVKTSLPNGVDDTGLLVAQTPLTKGQVSQIATSIDQRAGLERLTHGMIAMHRESGNSYVMARGTVDSPTMLHRSPVAIAPDRPDGLVWGHGDGATLTTSFTGQIVPTSRSYADPGYANHPAVNLTWYHGASLAAALTEMDAQYVVRLMTSDEYGRLVLCDGEMTEEDVISKAHLSRLNGRGARYTVSVVGEEAESRKDEWGLVDVFGNVMIWTSDPSDLVDARKGYSISNITRMLRGASWDNSPPSAHVSARYRRGPSYSNSRIGTRFVAVPRASSSLTRVAG